MSSGPPQGSDDERGLAAEDSRPARGDGAPAGEGETAPASPPAAPSAATLPSGEAPTTPALPTAELLMAMGLPPNEEPAAVEHLPTFDEPELEAFAVSEPTGTGGLAAPAAEPPAVAAEAVPEHQIETLSDAHIETLPESHVETLPEGHAEALPESHVEAPPEAPTPPAPEETVTSPDVPVFVPPASAAPEETVTSPYVPAFVPPPSSPPASTAAADAPAPAEARPPAEPAAPPPVPTGAPPAPLEPELPIDPEELIAAATVLTPEAEAVMYEEEARAEAQADPKHAARLVHEAAHVRETELGQARDAGKAYTQALTGDPSLQLNSWALYRLFLARGFWDNLVRLLDAELRFAQLPTPGDRADLLVEKGRLLEDRLGRDEDARAAYRAAVEADPAHPAALFALLLAGLRAGAREEVSRALTGLVARVTEPEERALLAVELARLERGPLGAGLDPERARAAAETLQRALLGPVADAPILGELDRLSLATEGGDLRARVLDVFDSRFGREDGHARIEPAFAVAMYREKARLLQKRGAREPALAVLERALRVAPGHPLLVADLLEAAEEANRPDALGVLLDEPRAAGSARKQEEAVLRRAESAARTGALGEAIGALDRLPAESRFAPLAALARARILARLGDAEGLAQLYVGEADRLLGAGEGEGATGADEGARREAAHLLVRAATARREFLNDRAGADPLLRRALELVPDYAPALEGLRIALAHAEDWRGLAGLFEAEAGRTSDPARKQALFASLLIVHRDLLHDPETARRFEAPEAPAADAGDRDDLVALARAVDQAGDAFTASGEGGGEVVRQLRALAGRVPEAALAAELRLLAARASAAAGDRGGASALVELAYHGDAGSLAAATLERQHLDAGRPAEVPRVLEAEIGAAEKAGRREVARALRFRLAFAAAEVGRHGEALRALQPLRAAGDRAAVLWSVELGRAAANPSLLAELLGEPGLGELALGEGPPARMEWSLAQAEAREELGERAEAAAIYQTVLEAGAGTPAAVEASLGLLRLKSAPGTPAAERTAALARLADDLRGQAGADELRREADLALLAADLPGASAEDGETPLDGLRAWLRGLRAGDPARRTDGLDRVARAAGNADAAADVWAAIGLSRKLGQQPQAWEALERAAAVPTPPPLVALLATDLAGGETLQGTLGRARADRASRLAEAGPAAAALAESLLLEEGAAALDAGQARPAAAAFTRALELAPDSLEATEGLVRVARATGRTRDQAAGLRRLGALLRDPRRAAEAHATAAALYEQEGQEGAAIAAWLDVLGCDPGHGHAYNRLHALLQKRGDAAALEQLLGFAIAQAADPGVQAGLYAERAELRLEQVGRRREAIHDLRRAVERDPGRVSSLRALARLAAEDERFANAVGLLERALAQAGPEAAYEIRLELGAALAGAEQPQRALETLRAAVEARPEEPLGRERLIALCLRQHQLDAAISELEALGRLADGPEAKAAVAVRLGRLERDQRRDRVRALAAFRSALTLDPLGEAAAELVATVGDGPLSPADTVAVEEAIGGLRRALAEDPLQVRRLECLRDLARLRGLGDLRDAAGQLLTLLGAAHERGRSRDLHKQLSTATINALGVAVGGTPNLLSQVWPHVAEGVARMHAPDPSAAGVSRHTRLVPGAEPRLAWAEAASVALGLPSLSIYIGGLDEVGVVALDIPEPCLVLGRGVVGGDPSSRFRIGRALALLRQKATAVEHLPLDELEQLWAAAAWLNSQRPDPRWDQATLKAKGKALAKGMPRRELKSLESLPTSLKEVRLDVPAWRESVLRTANRFGLLVVGDLAVALRVLAGPGAIIPADLRKPACLDLVRFALSDQYAALRREAGFS